MFLITMRSIVYEKNPIMKLLNLAWNNCKSQGLEGTALKDSCVKNE